MRLNGVAILLMLGMPAFTYASNQSNLEDSENLERYSAPMTSRVISDELAPDAEMSLISRLGAFLYPVLSSLVNWGRTAQSAIEEEKSLSNKSGVVIPKISMHSAPAASSPTASSSNDELFLPHTVMHYLIQHKDVITLNTKRFKVHVDMIDFGAFQRTGELGMDDTAEWGSKVYLSRLYFKKIAKADDHIFFVGEGKTSEDTAYAYRRSYPGMRFFMALIALDGPVYEPLLPVAGVYKNVTRKPEPFSTTSLCWMEPSYKFSRKSAQLPTANISYGVPSFVQQNAQRCQVFPLFRTNVTQEPSPVHGHSPIAGYLSPEYDQIIAEHAQKMRQMALQEHAFHALRQSQNQRSEVPPMTMQKPALPSKSRMIRPSIEFHRSRRAENSAMDFIAIASKRHNLKASQGKKKRRAPISSLRNVSACSMAIGPSKSRMIRPSAEFYESMGAENSVMDYAVMASQYLGSYENLRKNNRLVRTDVVTGALEDDV